MKFFNANFHKFSLSTFSTNFGLFPKALCAEFLFPEIAFDFCHRREYNKRKSDILLQFYRKFAEKNADRKIDGKTYLETFSEKYNSYIEKIKHSENYKLKIAATNKKDIISSYLKKVNQENKSEPSEPGKQ